MTGENLVVRPVRLLRYLNTQCGATLQPLFVDLPTAFFSNYIQEFLRNIAVANFTYCLIMIVKFPFVLLYYCEIICGCFLYVCMYDTAHIMITEYIHMWSELKNFYNTDAVRRVK